MQSKIRVAVVRGGPSSEYEVSLKTGAMIFQYLNRKKYTPKLITISKSGKWPITFRKLKQNFDIVFNAMHGEYGEDGTVQTLLDKHKIPYTGSGVAASRDGMDKIASMKLFKRAGLAVPQTRVVRTSAALESAARSFGFPVVVKPKGAGSSVGVSIVKRLSALARAFQKAVRRGSVIVQQFIAGREVTCGVLEIEGGPAALPGSRNSTMLRAKDTQSNFHYLALPPTEIVPKGSSFFDYRAKYAKGGSDEITPARISKAETQKVQHAALLAHRAIRASGYSRSDFILQEPTTNNSKRKTWILEINTLPGLTAGSLLPKAARAAGISFPKLLELIIEAGFKNG